MKKAYLILIVFLLLAGCLPNNYKELYPPKHIYITKIKEGEHTNGYFITDGIDTVYTPKGNTWIKQEDISLYYREPTSRDEIIKKSVLLHENVHCQHSTGEHRHVWMGPLYEKYTEFAGYAIQIRYQIMKGIEFQEKEIENYVRILMDYRIADEKEIRSWINKIVIEAKTDYKREK